MTTINALGELVESGVDKVGAVLLDNVQKAETEFKLGIQLEVRQINVATHADLYVTIKRFHPQRTMLTSRKVDSGVKTCYQIRTEIVVTRSSKLYIEGKGKITALDVLGSIATTYLLVKHYVFLAEMDCGSKT